MEGDPLLHEGAAATLPGTVRDAASALLIDRLGRGKHSTANTPLVKMLFGKANGTPHCHRIQCKVQLTTLREYHCAAVMAGGRCVCTAVFRHVPLPHRRPGSLVPFTELLLLAVEQEQENKGFGRAMTEYVKRCSAIAASTHVLVISSQPIVNYWCACTPMRQRSTTTLLATGARPKRSD
jgi:hypothetical protein